MGFRLSNIRKRNYSLSNDYKFRFVEINDRLKIDFYSSLNEKNITDKEYEDVKKLFKLLNLETLGDMNKSTIFKIL